MPEPEVQPPQSPDAGVPVTPEQVEEARKQTEAANIALMDQMEASVPENGQFFEKVGAKSYSPGSIDDRALILKEGRTDPVDGMVAYVVVTREGPKVMHMKASQFQDLFLPNPNKFSDAPRLMSIVDKPIILQVGGKFNAGKETSFVLYDILPNDNIANDLMAKSIAKTRETSSSQLKKYQEDIQAEQRKQAMAKGLSDLLKPSPQPPAGTGPTV